MSFTNQPHVGKYTMNMETIYPRYHPFEDWTSFCFVYLHSSFLARLFLCHRPWKGGSVQGHGSCQRKQRKSWVNGAGEGESEQFCFIIEKNSLNKSEIYPADSWSSTTTSEARIFPPTILRVAVFFRWFSKKDIAELRRNHVLQRTGTGMKMDGECFKMHSWEFGKRLQYFLVLKYTPWNYHRPWKYAFPKKDISSSNHHFSAECVSFREGIKRKKGLWCSQLFSRMPNRPEESETGSYSWTTWLEISNGYHPEIQ